ncbi:MAG: hypothetical protein ACKO72_06385 [Actinomycetes bacterium]
MRRPRPALPPTVLLVGVLVFTACGGGNDDAAGPTTTTGGAATVTLSAGPMTVERTGPTGEASPADVQALLDAGAAYIRTASLDPMAGRAPALRAVTTTEAAARTTGPDGAALTDVGLGRVDAVRVAAVPAPVTILTDANGAAVLGAVTIDVTITGEAAKGPVTVRRTGELAFTRVGDSWLLDSWRLTVTRDGRGVPSGVRTSSTTAAP